MIILVILYTFTIIIDVIIITRSFEKNKSKKIENLHDEVENRNFQFSDI